VAILGDRVGGGEAGDQRRDPVSGGIHAKQATKARYAIREVDDVKPLARLEQLSQQVGHAGRSGWNRDLVDQHPSRADDADVGGGRAAYSLEGRERRRVQVAGGVDGDPFGVRTVGEQVGPEVLNHSDLRRRGQSHLRRGNQGQGGGGEQKGSATHISTPNLNEVVDSRSRNLRR
jgi:hypothetical protein